MHLSTFITIAHSALSVATLYLAIIVVCILVFCTIVLFKTGSLKALRDLVPLAEVMFRFRRVKSRKPKKKK